MGRYFLIGAKELKKAKPHLRGFEGYELNATIAKIYQGIRDGGIKIEGANGRVLGEKAFYLTFEGEAIEVALGYVLPREQRLGIEGFDINERAIHFRHQDACEPSALERGDEHLECAQDTKHARRFSAGFLTAQNGHSEKLRTLRNKLLEIVERMEFPINMGDRWES